jgi:carbonic anhydrase/acetyltransferase-like protein (isoleucine patch superfamily)
MILKFKDKSPKIDVSSFVADSANLIGEVTLEKNTSIWFNAVLRADINKITIGEGSNIQDGTVCHVDHDKAVIVGKNVTVGHNVTLHGCKIKDGALIGMGAVILDGAVIGKKSIVGAGSVVSPGTVIPDRSLVLGIPARVKKELNEKEMNAILKNSTEYVKLSNSYKGGDTK